MILLEEPAAAFNVHRAGLDVPPAHVCRLPPQSPGTRRGGVRRVYRSGEIYKLAVKPCLTRCKGRGSPPDKGGYKKTHPFGPKSPRSLRTRRITSSTLIGERCRPSPFCLQPNVSIRRHVRGEQDGAILLRVWGLKPNLFRWSLIGDWIEFFQIEKLKKNKKTCPINYWKF